VSSRPPTRWANGNGCQPDHEDRKDPSTANVPRHPRPICSARASHHPGCPEEGGRSSSRRTRLSLANNEMFLLPCGDERDQVAALSLLMVPRRRCSSRRVRTRTLWSRVKPKLELVVLIIAARRIFPVANASAPEHTARPLVTGLPGKALRWAWN